MAAFPLASVYLLVFEPLLSRTENISVLPILRSLEMPLCCASATPVPISVGLALGASPSLLNIPLIKQEQDQWCWAAVMEMVLRFHGGASDPQCDLASTAFGLNGCCNHPDSSLCNRPLPVMRISSEWSRYGISSSHKSNPVSFAEIMKEIDSKRPLELGLKWTEGGGHAVLLIGYDDESTPKVHIHDPWRREVVGTYDYAASAYGEGQWSWTWIGISEG